MQPGICCKIHKGLEQGYKEHMNELIPENSIGKCISEFGLDYLKANSIA